MNKTRNKIFICFAAEDRYCIAEPIVYHLKNYGINTWYDRYCLVMSDNRVAKNLCEGAQESQYAVVIISKNTSDSKCAMEELSIIESRYRNGSVIVFPVLYEIMPQKIPQKLCWIKELIFKEVDRHSGTREICNHIACKITDDIKQECTLKTIQDIVTHTYSKIPPIIYTCLCKYLKIDAQNLNSRITMLYAIYLFLTTDNTVENCSDIVLVNQIFERLFSETSLNLDVDYRELWLLENSMCILLNHIFAI